MRDKNMKKHLKLYLTENLDELINYLHGRIENFGITGNSVELTRSLCQFGCYNLLISNHHTVDVIYKFIKKEYDMKNLGEPEAASATRFLALYSVFEGMTEQALLYYKESQRLFWSLDLYEEELLMLIESYNWLYLWMNNQEEMYYCLQRLKYIQDKIEPSIDTFKTIEQTPSTEKLDSAYYYWYIIEKKAASYEKYTNNNKNKMYLIHTIPSLCMKLVNSYNDHEKLQQTAFTLLANVNQFKHPFYKAYSYFLVGNALKNKSYLFHAKELFLANNLSELAELCDAESNISKVKNRPTKLTFKLFNNFEVYDGEQQISLMKWERKKAEELLLYLLIQPNLQALKEVIIDKFYPEENYK